MQARGAGGGDVSGVLFMEEIQTRESDFLARGGKLIAPLPTPRIITADGWHRLA
jgi:hypothetical protein